MRQASKMTGALSAALLMIAPTLLSAQVAAEGPGTATVRVTPDNFKRAETDFNFKTKVESGAFGKIMHVRKPTPIDKQFVIRANRDMLYSFGMFDLSHRF